VSAKLGASKIRAVVSGRLSVLFWFLVASIALPVVVPDGPIIRVAMGVALFVLMLSGLHAISSHRRVLHVGIALAFPAVAVNLIGLATGDLLIYLVSQYLYLAFFVYLAFQILRWTLNQEDVDKETIYGAVSVYLLMALIWGIAYYSIALMHPGSFHFPEEDELGQIQAQRVAALEAERELSMAPEWTERANSASGTMMYYSFVTLTTLGYGDMYPVRDGTRILAMLEATLGQLYLVILVARLVGLYTAQQMEERKKAPPT
jgi:hypothetical protein